MPAHKKVREKNCIVCGNVFTAICQKTLDKRQFCSHRCQGDNEHRQLINEMLGMDVKCQQCGIPMTAISVNILKKKRFCSHACCGKYELDHKISGIITKGGHHTEATCERFREIGKQRDMTRMSNEAVVSKWLKDRGQTKQEKRLERWLQEEHMSYKFVGDGQLCIASYWPDFINTNGDNIIIELSLLK